jgi:aryl-alcohol dehydrogenase-like predicted oxidoreductase
MGMSFAYGRPPNKEEMIALRLAGDRGITIFDTAEAYGPFVNEELVGEGLTPFRGQVAFATKFGFTFVPTGSKSVRIVCRRTSRRWPRSRSSA